MILLCHQHLRLRSEGTHSEDSGINCCRWDMPAEKRLLLPVCGSPALAADGGTAERQRQSALGHKTCCWENRWLTGIAGVFCTGKEREREKGKVLEQSSTCCASFEFCKLLIYTLDQSHVSVTECLLLTLETNSDFNFHLLAFSTAQTGKTAMYGRRLETPECTSLR